MAGDLVTIATSKVALNWKEPYVSDGLNRQARAEPRGIVRGFWVVPSVSNYAVTMKVDELYGDSVAMLVGRGVGEAHALVYREAGDLEVALTGAPINTIVWIVAEAAYVIGSATVTKIRYYTQADVDVGGFAWKGVVLARLKTPAATNQLVTDALILDRWVDHQWKWRGARPDIKIVQTFQTDASFASQSLSAGAGATWSYDAANKWRGTAALKLAAAVGASSISTAQELGQRTRLDAGDVLVVTVVSKQTAGGAVTIADASVKFSFYDAAGVLLSTNSVLMWGSAGAQNVFTATYKVVTGTVVAPAGTVYCDQKISIEARDLQVWIGYAAIGVVAKASALHGVADERDEVGVAHLTKVLFFDANDPTAEGVSLQMQGGKLFAPYGPLNVIGIETTSLLATESVVMLPSSQKVTIGRQGAISNGNEIARFDFTGGAVAAPLNAGTLGAYLRAVASANWSGAAHKTNVEIWVSPTTGAPELLATFLDGEIKWTANDWPTMRFLRDAAVGDGQILAEILASGIVPTDVGAAIVFVSNGAWTSGTDLPTRIEMKVCPDNGATLKMAALVREAGGVFQLAVVNGVAGNAAYARKAALQLVGYRASDAEVVQAALNVNHGVSDQADSKAEVTLTINDGADVQNMVLGADSLLVLVHGAGRRVKRKVINASFSFVAPTPANPLPEIVDARGAANIVVTLPAPAVAGDGFEITLKDGDGAVGTWSRSFISHDDVVLIDGGLSTLAVMVRWGAITLYCDGIAWFVKARSGNEHGHLQVDVSGSSFAQPIPIDNKRKFVTLVSATGDRAVALPDKTKVFPGHEICITAESDVGNFRVYTYGGSSGGGGDSNIGYAATGTPAAAVFYPMAVQYESVTMYWTGGMWLVRCRVVVDG